MQFFLLKYPFVPAKRIYDFFYNGHHAANCLVSFSLKFFFVFSDRNDRKIARMTGHLERPESRNDRKSRKTGKPELLETPEQPELSLQQ
jgi:hypothetical protein